MPPSVRGSPRRGHRRRKVNSFPRELPDFLEPRPGFGAVNHAPQKAQSLACIVAVLPNVVFSDLRVQAKKTVHAPGFGKYVSRVAKLRGFDDNSFLNVENVFVAKQVDPARQARELTIEERVVIRTPAVRCGDDPTVARLPVCQESSVRRTTRTTLLSTRS